MSAEPSVTKIQPYISIIISCDSSLVPNQHQSIARISAKFYSFEDCKVPCDRICQKLI